MSKPVLSANPLSIHFIGIGGAGMSGIAKVLLEMGFSVSGSDLKESRYTKNLAKLGARVIIGHHPANLKNPDLVVISGAIPQENCELKKAKERGIPILTRAQMLARVAAEKIGVAVAGTHGKTTTTSMISYILQKGAMEPTFLIGGELNDIGSNAQYGEGKFCVFEADESDGSLMVLAPKIAVVTNVEADHLDYHKSFRAIEELFLRWLEKLPADGLAIVFGDNSNIQRLAFQLGKPYVTFGFQEENDYFATNIRSDFFHSSFDVATPSSVIGRISLKVPGRHNILNALAATVFALTIGVEFSQIAAALENFSGVQRRFQFLGSRSEIVVLDDYAHHPTEVRATLETAKLGSWRRVICVFQPHRYTRTKFLKEEFGQAFNSADLMIVTDIYSAGEEPIPGVTGKLLVDTILRNNPRQNLVYLPKMADIKDYLLSIVESGDLILTMGAGDIWTVGDELLSHLFEEDLSARKIS